MNDKVIKCLQEIQEQHSRGIQFAQHYISVNDPEIDAIVEAFDFISKQDLASVSEVPPAQIIGGTSAVILCGDHYFQSILTEKGRLLIEKD